MGGRVSMTAMLSSLTATMAQGEGLIAAVQRARAGTDVARAPPGRDLTAARDTNGLGRRVISPTFRAGPQPLSGFPGHADEPPWTPNARTAKPRTRCPAFDLPG